MPSVSYPLQRNGPKLLTFSYDKGYYNLQVSLKDKVLARFGSPEELTGAKVTLPDETSLGLTLKDGLFGVKDLLVSCDGYPLPGSPDDKVANITIAAASTFLIAGLATLVVLIMMVRPQVIWHTSQDPVWRDERAVAVTFWIVIVIWFALLAAFIWRRSKEALIGAVGSYGLAIALLIFGSTSSTRNIVGVLIIGGLLMIFWVQVQGFSGFAALKREELAMLRRLNSVHSMQIIGQPAPRITPLAPKMAELSSQPIFLPPQQTFTPIPSTPVSNYLPYGNAQLFTLRRGEPKRLMIRYAPGFTNVQVLLDGHVVGEFPRLQDQWMRDAIIKLPDDSTLTIGVITDGLFNKPRLSVRRNGYALPGSADDYSRRHTIAAITLTCVTILTVIFTALSDSNTSFAAPIDKFISQLMCVVSVAYIILTIFVWNKSRKALGAAVALYSLDLLALFIPGEDGIAWTAIAMHIIVLVLLVRGFKGIDSAETQQYMHTNLPSPARLSAMPNWLPKHPAQMAQVESDTGGLREEIR